MFKQQINKLLIIVFLTAVLSTSTFAEDTNHLCGVTIGQTRSTVQGTHVPDSLNITKPCILAGLQGIAKIQFCNNKVDEVRWYRIYSTDNTSFPIYNTYPNSYFENDLLILWNGLDNAGWQYKNIYSLGEFTIPSNIVFVDKYTKNSQSRYFSVKTEDWIRILSLSVESDTPCTSGL